MGFVKVILNENTDNVIESAFIRDNMVMVQGSNVSDGSIINVHSNQAVLLVGDDGILDYTTEEGCYSVQFSSPSAINGGDEVSEEFERVKSSEFANARVCFINLKEIENIDFGIKNLIKYYDEFYGEELFASCEGAYSMRIINPIRFYMEVISKDRCFRDDVTDMIDINAQYVADMVMALQDTMSQMSMEGIDVPSLAGNGVDITKYVATILKEEWKELRGMEISGANIYRFSYDEESEEIITNKNQENNCLNTDNCSNTLEESGVSSQNNAWICKCGKENSSKFCENCGEKRPMQANAWVCKCGMENSSKFCENCGSKRLIG